MLSWQDYQPLSQAALDHAMQNPASLNDYIGNNAPVLIYALRSSVVPTDAVERLLALGANPNLGCKFASDQTPLNEAIWRRNVRAVKALLAAGANTQALDYYGRTPVETARWLQTDRYPVGESHQRLQEIIAVLSN